MSSPQVARYNTNWSRQKVPLSSQRVDDTDRSSEGSEHEGKRYGDMEKVAYSFIGVQEAHCILRLISRQDWRHLPK
jgi:hypothetical protein